MGSRSFCSPAPDLVLIMKKKRREGQKQQREIIFIPAGWLRCLCNHTRRAKPFLTTAYLMSAYLMSTKRCLQFMSHSSPCTR